jgi:hypothetical protein
VGGSGLRGAGFHVGAAVEADDAWGPIGPPLVSNRGAG